jgi:AcrR family transcriptional regulator
MSSVTTTEAEPTARMPAPQRRASILEAATGVFGERGYVGTTTDAVAKAAGVSQPYVVRMFGTKEQLFLEVLHRALERLLTTFRGVIERPRRDGEPEELERRIGLAYADLLQDRGLLLSLMQGFMLGADPVIGPAARAGFLEVYRLVREEAGLSPQAAGTFLSGGMMLNTLVAIRMADDYDDDPLARELIQECAPHKYEMLLRAAERTKAGTA